MDLWWPCRYKTYIYESFLLLSFNDLNHICYSIYSSDHYYYIIINRILLLLSWYFGITFHVCMENRSWLLLHCCIYLYMKWMRNTEKFSRIGYNCGQLHFLCIIRIHDERIWGLMVSQGSRHAVEIYIGYIYWNIIVHCPLYHI